MVTILIMSAKIITLGFLKIKVFWSKGYDVITSFHDITNRILSRDSNYIVDVVVWPKFGNSSISIREVIITSISWGCDQKNQFFFEGWSWLQLNNLGLVLVMSWKFYQCGKRVKTRIQKVFGTNSYIYRSYRGIRFAFFRIAIFPILAILCTGEQLFRR